MSGDEGDDKKGKAKPELNAVSVVKLQPFWPNSPATWFISAEAQFTLSRITSDVSKYNYVVASLPQDVAESIMDVLQEPPVINLYAHLKKILIERHSLSIEKRIKKLISDEHMGDKKPSEFYRQLKSLAVGDSGTTVGEDLVLKLWLNRLPQVINIALIPHKSDSVDKLLNVADQVHEAMLNVSAIEGTSARVNQNPFSNSRNVQTDRIEKLEHEIHELKQMISNLNTNYNNGSRSNSRGRSNNRSRSRSRTFNKNGKLCWYHFKFGECATKCVAPCSHTPKTNTDSTN